MYDKCQLVVQLHLRESVGIHKSHFGKKNKNERVYNSIGIQVKLALVILTIGTQNMLKSISNKDVDPHSKFKGLRFLTKGVTYNRCEAPHINLNALPCHYMFILNLSP